MKLSARQGQVFMSILSHLRFIPGGACGFSNEDLNKLFCEIVNQQEGDPKDLDKTGASLHVLKKPENNTPPSA